jgi:hypothetical protein
MKSSDKDIIYCNHCEHRTNHLILAQEIKPFYPTNHPEMEIEFAEGKWEILICEDCEVVTFRETWETSEDYDYNKGKIIPTVHYYPIRKEKLKQIILFKNLPQDLSRIYKEIVGCFNNNFNILCAGGIRALIEGICKEKSINEGPVSKILKDGIEKVEIKNNLEGKINGLKEKGIIHQDKADILHELRFLGNEALHVLDEPSKEELKIAIEIVEHILIDLFEISTLKDDFQKAKEGRKDPPF